MAREGAFEGLVWEEVHDDGEGAGACCPETEAARRPAPAGLGRPHADRARQFMPFAALRGYYELVGEKEKVVEPRRPLSEGEARELTQTLAGLTRGTVVRCTYYEDDGYRTITGAASQIDMIYHDLWVVRTRIPFDEICALEALG